MANGGSGSTPQTIPTSDIQPNGNAQPSNGPASQSQAERVAASSTQPLTTETILTVVPITTTRHGRITTELITETITSVVPANTLGSSGNGNGGAQLGSPKKNMGAIAGGVTGGLIALSLFAALLFFLLRRRRRVRQEVDITSHMAMPGPDLFRPSPGTGWDVESASNRSSSTSASSGPFVRPMSQTGAHHSLPRKPVPGINPVPTVSEDPFWDPSQQFNQVPIIPIKTEQVQAQGASIVAHDPFLDPPPRLAPLNGSILSEGSEGHSSRLSTVSTVVGVPAQTTAVPLGVAM